MSEFNIEVQGGSSVRLPTAGKYCEKDIIVTASGGGGNTEEFIGIKYSNFSGLQYNLPKIADARSLDKILKEPSGLDNATKNVENGFCLLYAFANINKNPNGGYFAQLKEVYLPSKATRLVNTFDHCTQLNAVHGDLSNITSLEAPFRDCTSLDINAIIARMTKLQSIGANSFYGCTQVAEVTLPTTVTTITSNAFNGCTNLLDIYVPWAEGVVANAPWGATNATIHYNSEV